MSLKSHTMAGKKCVEKGIETAAYVSLASVTNIPGGMTVTPYFTKERKTPRSRQSQSHTGYAKQARREKWPTAPGKQGRIAGAHA